MFQYCVPTGPSPLRFRNQFQGTVEGSGLYPPSKEGTSNHLQNRPVTPQTLRRGVILRFNYHLSFSPIGGCHNKHSLSLKTEPVDRHRWIKWLERPTVLGAGDPGRWHGLPMHAWNRITVPRGIVEGHPAAHSGAAMRAILDHFQQA